MSSRIVIKLGAVRRYRLERARRKTRDAAFRTRITIVLLFDRGFCSPHIAEVLGRAPATVVRVAHRFLERGEEGLEDGRQANGTNKVDADLLQALAELVNRLPEEFGLTRPTWTREAFRKVLAEETEVWLSVTTVGRMLKKLRVRWGMPKPIVACPWSPQRKGRRIKQIRRVVENLGPNEVAYYEDEVDIHLNPKIGRDWMHRGEQKEVLTPGQNNKHYVAGALAVDGGDFVFVESTSKNSDLFIAMLEALHGHHPRARRIHLVLDNYCIHSSRRVQVYLSEHGDLFQLHFLPPYCPDHNKIERLWRELHANVTRNHRHPTMEGLMSDGVWPWLKAEAKKRRKNAEPAARRGQSSKVA